MGIEGRTIQDYHIRALLSEFAVRCSRSETNLVCVSNPSFLPLPPRSPRRRPFLAHTLAPIIVARSCLCPFLSPPLCSLSHSLPCCSSCDAVLYLPTSRIQADAQRQRPRSGACGFLGETRRSGGRPSQWRGRAAGSGGA